jgi:sugar O-acyltransferase (sialic acid O-acetyltransferase NeuD family)
MPERAFVCWGAGGHARVIAELLASNGDRLEALIDGAVALSFLGDVPLLRNASELDAWLHARGTGPAPSGAVAIGRCGPDRMQRLKLLQDRGIATPALRHPLACVSSSSTLGLGSQVLAFALVAAQARVGDACIINHRASVDHECVLEEGVHVAPGATLCGCVHVGKNVFVGAGAVVLPRLRIGENAVIGAGAVVIRDVPAGAVVAGNPARQVS